MAGLADEMEVAWVTVRRLEPRASLAEVHLARDAGVHHPLERAVHGGAADAGGIAADELVEIVGTQVPFLAQEDVQNAIALTGVLAPRGTERGEVGKKAGHRQAADIGHGASRDQAALRAARSPVAG